MKKPVIIILVLIFLNALSCIAQFKIDTSKMEYSFRPEVGWFYQFNFMNTESEVLGDMTTNRLGVIETPSKHTTDEPIRHSAFYTILGGQMKYNKKYAIDLDLLFEHRGMSYGTFTNNIAFYPYYKFSYVDNLLKLKGDFLKAALSLGTYRNEIYHKGLKIYNVDVQGNEAHLTYKNLTFGTQHIGDLGNGIGLSIDEFVDYSVTFRKKYSNISFDLGVNGSYTMGLKPTQSEKILPSFFEDYWNFGIYGSLSFEKHFNFYFQYEFRDTKSISFPDNSAFLVGFQYEKKTKNYSVLIEPKFRYYGWGYNYGHRDDRISFRPVKEIEKNGMIEYIKDTGYGKTIGVNLYPLNNYLKPFSQWAVYTDYQYQNIAGIEMTINFVKRIDKIFDFELEFESVTLLKEYEVNNSKTFTYVFYTAYSVWNVGKYIDIKLGFSNKTMNLDKHFQTFYMRKLPVMNAMFSYNI